MSLSQHSFIGRLTKAPELRHTPAGVAVCTFTVACDSDIKDQDSDFYTVVAWRQLGETCANYLEKGREVFVQGRPKTRSYDNNAGQKVYVTEVIADKVQFLGPKGSNAGNDNASTPTQEEPASSRPPF